MRKVIVFSLLVVPPLLLLFWDSPPKEVLVRLRLPELLLSFGFGGSLAAAGGVFREFSRIHLPNHTLWGVLRERRLGRLLPPFLAFPLSGELSQGD